MNITRYHNIHNDYWLPFESHEVLVHVQGIEEFLYEPHSREVSKVGTPFLWINFDDGPSRGRMVGTLVGLLVSVLVVR